MRGTTPCPKRGRRLTVQRIGRKWPAITGAILFSVIVASFANAPTAAADSPVVLPVTIEVVDGSATVGLPSVVVQSCIPAPMSPCPPCPEPRVFLQDAGLRVQCATN